MVEILKKDSPPSTNLIEELSDPNTKIESAILAYKRQMRDFNDNRLDSLYQTKRTTTEEFSMKKIGDSGYWSEFAPKKPGGYEDDKEVFIITFWMYVKDGRKGSKRPGHWRHRIYWSSNTRDKKLDPETIKKIFTKIYEGKPEEVVTKFQENYIGEESISLKAEEKLIFPLVDSLDNGALQKQEQVKQIIREVLPLPESL